MPCNKLARFCDCCRQLQSHKRTSAAKIVTETMLLEDSLTKICNLLAVGFGDAGAEVIADNMRSAGDLNPMVPGQKVVAIFGFCDIRNFTDATEVGLILCLNLIALKTLMQCSSRSWH